MHELGIVTGILETTKQAAREAGATRVVSVKLRIGEMCEVVPEALSFAWETFCEDDPLTQGAALVVEDVRPVSACVQCGAVFEHDRFHCKCPQCGSGQILLQHGRELDIVSIDIETPDEEEEA